jgi:hypothetical protein
MAPGYLGLQARVTRSLSGLLVDVSELSCDWYTCAKFALFPPALAPLNSLIDVLFEIFYFSIRICRILY